MHGGNPTLSHAFLDSLHRIGLRLARAPAGRRSTSRCGTATRLAGAVPLYAKSHSYGEYVFDWAWADAYERHGLAYYPKLLAAVPFTPATGPRLLGGHRRRCAAQLAAALLDLAHGSATFRRCTCSSRPRRTPPRCDAPDSSSAPACSSTGATRATRTFDDFLAALSHDKRKKIRQERRRVADAGVVLRRATGREASEADWDFFTACYRRTYREHRSTPYLNREFFGDDRRAACRTTCCW